MAAGTGASSGNSRGSSTALESTLDRRFQGLSNTMESIQGLSTWCIENKKYHSLVVKYWTKWLRKSDASHRLNLLYLANDVIQNCKRKNAIVYRTAFAGVLPEAFQLVNNVGDPKVVRSVDRILTIWEERSVYTEELISELRASRVKEESPPSAAAEEPKATVNSNAALKSKIVAEFVPQAFVEHLSKYKSSVEDVELREKQLAAMRVDVCSTEALKKLKDKAGGKKFSKDFEDGSTKLQEFVSFLDRQSKGGPPLLDALGNADIFYEMQYKEVKIVASAYKTFANRVLHLKRKLDTLKSTLPDLDDSPIPSPSADAPSPTGSESPFRGLGTHLDLDPDLDGLAMDDEAEITLGEAPSPLSSPGGSPKQGFTVGDKDNRDVEDMELSEEEEESVSIIVQEHVASPAPTVVSNPVPVVTQPSVATAEGTPIKQATPSSATSGTNLSGSGNLANVDLGKISSILSSITSVMKNTGVSPGTSSSLTPASSSYTLKTTPPVTVAPQGASPLANILSKVDVIPEEILSALSKTQGQASGLQGLSSLLHSPAGSVSSTSSSTGRVPPPASTPAAPSRGLPLSSTTPMSSPPVPTVGPNTNPQRAPVPTPATAPHRGMRTEQQKDQKTSTSTLESKIHSFLQGNPGFSAFNLGLASEALQGGSSDLSPLAGADNLGGTPVRDEAETGGTPTQDEIMDKPGLEPFLSNPAQTSSGGATKPADGSLSPTAYHNEPSWQDPNKPHHVHSLQGAQNGQEYHRHQLPYGGKEGVRAESGFGHYQHIATHVSVPTQHRDGPPSNTQGNSTSGPVAVGLNSRGGEGGWYGNAYLVGHTPHHPSNHSMAAPGGSTDSTVPGQYPYQGQGQEPYQSQDPQTQANNSRFFTSPLPPIPQLPPPPSPGLQHPSQDFLVPPSSVMVGGVMVPVEPPLPNPEMEGDRGGISGDRVGEVVIHDHQHKSMHHPDDFHRHPGDLHRHPDDLLHYHDDLRRHPDGLRRHPDGDLRRYQDNLHHQPDNLHPLDDLRRHPGDLRCYPQDLPPRHPDDHYHHPDNLHHLPIDDPYYHPGRERLTPPISPSEDPYYYDYPQRSPSPPLYGHRHPLPSHPELRRPPPPRPPHHPPHPAHHPPHPRGHPRGPPRPPFHGPEPRQMLRGKRPGPPFGGHPRGGGPGGPFFPPKRPHLPPRF